MSRNQLSVILLLLVGAFAAGAELPDSSAAMHMGVASCAASQCHGSAVPGDGSNVLQNEYVTWTQDDPHARAYDVLNGELSIAIAARLGIPSARDADLCLDCHADNVPAARRDERFQISDGVGCEACHGGAENWLSSHYNSAEVTHAANIQAGLYPTENETDRATLCLSCHLGTSDKFATHRIMSAGHPRLAFELDTFTELWRTAGRQPHYRVDEDYVDRKAAVDHTDVWIAGLYAEARQRLALILDSKFVGETLFPELGLYDCHACHRSMKSVQWRALPRHGGAGPGVPFLNDGALVMILALTNAVVPQEADVLRQVISDLHKAAGSDADAIHTAAQRLDDQLNSLQTQMTKNVLRNSERKILDEILKSAAAGDFLDYVSAEHAFMAVQMLVIELGDSVLETQLDELANSLADDESYQPAQFAALLNALNEDTDVISQ